MVTQTVVDRDDPAFANPTKPIGSHMDEARAKKLAAQVPAGPCARTPAAAGAASCPRRGRSASSRAR